MIMAFCFVRYYYYYRSHGWMRGGSTQSGHCGRKWCPRRGWIGDSCRFRCSWGSVGRNDLGHYRACSGDCKRHYQERTRSFRMFALFTASVLIVFVAFFQICFFRVCWLSAQSNSMGSRLCRSSLWVAESCNLVPVSFVEAKRPNLSLSVSLPDLRLAWE